MQLFDSKSKLSLPLHLAVTDRINRDAVNQTFQLVRENGNESAVEFDIPWGIYRARVSVKVPHGTCSSLVYFSVLADHNRTLAVAPQMGPVQNDVPALVMGTAPFSFSYVQPTVVVFDKSVACKGAVGDPLDAGVVTENDEDAYYASVFDTPVLAQHQPVVVAVRLTDSHAGYHYIRVPAKVLRYVGMGSWPSSVSLNVNEDIIDYVADKPEDTLLCPRMYQTMTQ